jgi:hypothetical protein
MPRIIPDGWREVSVTGAAQREIETLAVLADGLPDAYSVYHAVHWTGMDGRYAIYGEIDFAVANRAGDLLLIEQKSGFLDETPDGLVKQYPGRSKSVPVQISRMVSNLREICTGTFLDFPGYCLTRPSAVSSRKPLFCSISRRSPARLTMAKSISP